MDIYGILNMLSDKSRLRIVNLLNEHKLTVNQISETLELSQANTSKHLKKLYDENILEKEKDRQSVYYFVNEKYKEICLIHGPVLEIFSEHQDGKADLLKLKTFLEK